MGEILSQRKSTEIFPFNFVCGWDDDIMLGLGLQPSKWLYQNPSFSLKLPSWLQIKISLVFSYINRQPETIDDGDWRSPYFIKLAPGLAILRQRPDLVLAVKEQQILGRKAEVERRHLSAMFSPRKKSKTFRLQRKMGLQKAKSHNVSKGWHQLIPALLVTQSKALTAVKSSLLSRQSKERGETPSTEAAHDSWKWKIFPFL